MRIKLYFAALFYPQFFKVINVVFAQSKLETANFTSNLYHSNNNAFGMKFPLLRFTLAKGEKNGFADYDTVLHSIFDYFERNKNLSTESDEIYLNELVNSGYAEDVQYKNKILSLM